jgi:predicted nuclease of predicted toxin-antitoxin system
MKLLLDENLSRRIVPFLQADFPGTSQVALEGLERASDLDVWRYAKDHDFVIVSKDSDFYELSLLHGSPPKVVWLQVGNVSKSAVMQLLLDNQETIMRLLADPDTACVEIG